MSRWTDATAAPVEERATRLRLWLGIAAAAVALGSVIGALVVHSHETRAFQRRQQDEALRSARQAESLAGLSLGQLATAAAFYQAVERLTQHKFQLMARSLLGAGALSGTGLIMFVPESHRSGFEHGHGYPILDRVSIGFHRAPIRTSYFPLAFGASNSGLEPPLGYDLGADPVRRSSLLRARDTGKPAATKVIHLPLGGTGIDVFLPVYHDGAPTRTVAQRRASLVGFAAGAFHVHDLTAAATSALPGGAEAQLLADGRTVAGPDLSGEETASAALRIANRRWLFVVHDPNGPSLDLPLLMAVFGTSLAALLGALTLFWSRSERVRELHRQASHDSLTGLRNRRRFEEDLRAELARSHRYRVPGALLMIDLDHFKRVNDTLGHAAGDQVIAEVAEVLRERARETDVLARLGGDEYAVVLPRCEMEEAQLVAVQLQDAIRGRLAAEDGTPRVTASIGLAPFGPGTPRDPGAILAKADAAMYAAKGAGRDAVRSYDFAEEPAVTGSQPAMGS